MSRTEDGRLDTLPAPPARTWTSALAAAFLSEAEHDEHRIGQGGRYPDRLVPRRRGAAAGYAVLAFIEHMWAKPLVLAPGVRAVVCSTDAAGPG